MNENEILRLRTISRQKTKKRGAILVSSKLQVLNEEEKKEATVTVTHKKYEELCKSKEHVLTMQPRYVNDSDTSDGEDDEMLQLASKEAKAQRDLLRSQKATLMNAQLEDTREVYVDKADQDY